MKKLQCDLCDVTAQGKNFEQWMKNLMLHYQEAHADVMRDSTKTDEDKMRWMADNRARFHAVKI